jgi:hypothetical protein
MVACPQCQQHITANQCQACGYQFPVKRINGHYLLHEMEHILHVERGILFTVKELALRPAQRVKEFLFQDRTKLVKPIIFILITALLSDFILKKLGISVTYFTVTGKSGNAYYSMFNQWMDTHIAYTNLLISFFIACILCLVFKKQGYSLFEILILVCYITGMSLLILTLGFIVQKLVPMVDGAIFKILAIAYYTWSLGVFFEGKLAINLIKAFGSMLLGIVAFTLSFEVLVFVLFWVFPR